MDYGPAPESQKEAQAWLDRHQRRFGLFIDNAWSAPGELFASTNPADGTTLAELTQFPLILPERSHAIRKLLETQAALSGHKLNVALEISSVQSILELVRAGHGHAILTPTALAASGTPEAFVLRKLTEPSLTSTLCLAVSAHKPLTPLTKHVLRLLRELILVAAETVPPTPQSRAHNKTR